MVAAVTMGGDTVFYKLGLHFGSGTDTLLPVSLVLACYCIALSTPSAAGISVEGNRSLWILKNLPITFAQIALSKILLNLTVTIPIFFVSSIVLSFQAGARFATGAAFLAAGIGMAVFCALLGLTVNMVFPKLDWKTQVQAVKQSASVLLTMLFGVAVVSVLVTVYVVSGMAFAPYALVCAAFLLATAGILWRILCTWGEKKFRSL